jgi:hypothetical protein
MPDAQVQFGVGGVALVRAADAMLRALGGTEVSFLFPAIGLPDDASVQLGLVDPQVEEVRFSPVVVRNLPTSNSGPRRRVEFLLPASVVRSVAIDRNVASGETLLNGALGVLLRGEMLHVEGIVTECFAGTAYLHRVTAVE